MVRIGPHILVNNWLIYLNQYSDIEQIILFYKIAYYDSAVPLHLLLNGRDVRIQIVVLLFSLFRWNLEWSICRVLKVSYVESRLGICTDNSWREDSSIIAAEVTVYIRASITALEKVIPGIVSYDSELVVQANLNVSSDTSARKTFLNSGTGAREMPLISFAPRRMGSGARLLYYEIFGTCLKNNVKIMQRAGIVLIIKYHF